MNARSRLAWGMVLAAAPLLPACSTGSAGSSEPVTSPEGAAPDAASGDSHDSGAATSSSGSSSGSSSSSGTSSHDSGSGVTGDDSGGAHHDAGTADAASQGDGGCIRPPYQTTNECTGIGMPGGPVIPSCSIFDSSGQLVCPTIPGCTVVHDPSGQYCMGDGVTCGLSDCGHICILPDWDPCYDVATGQCLEGC